MSPPRNDPIPNQNKNNLWLKIDHCLTSNVPPFYSGFKSLRHKANDDNPETTDTSHTYKDDTLRTNQDDSIENVKAIKNTNDDDKYKEENFQHQHINESVIKKPNMKKHGLNGWFLWISEKMSYNMW